MQHVMQARWAGRALAGIGLILLGASGHADTFNVSTGLDASNTLLSIGSQSDAHWVVPPQGGGAAVAAQTTYPGNNNYYGPWAANGPNSAWIARDANNTNNGPAAYTFSTTFNLTGLDLSTAWLTGSWAIDDEGTLALNGTTVSTLTPGAWTGLTPFSVPTGSALFLPGVNTLSITITNDDQFLEAVRLEGTVTANPAAVPEPGSVALLFGLSVTGAGFLIRRKRG